MSSGEMSATITGRFTSPSNSSNRNNSNVNNGNKKYPGTPKSPMSNTNTNTTGGNRNSYTRQRLLTTSIPAPRPVNLPSLRKEHASEEVPATSPATSHGWGSSTASSPASLANTEIIKSPIIGKDKHSTTLPQSTSELTNSTNATITPTIMGNEVNKDASSTTDLLSSSATSQPSGNATITTTTHAWAVPVVTSSTLELPSKDFPTAAEAASGKKSQSASLIDDKEYLKFAISDPNHLSWDEMVSDDLDYPEETAPQISKDTTTTDPVSPSERFTNDYDRTYPPNSTHHNTNNEQHHSKHEYKPYRGLEDYGYNNRHYESNRRQSNPPQDVPRRQSFNNDRWSRRDSVEPPYSNNNRRSSYDRKPFNPATGSMPNTPQISSGFHPTGLLQKPRRTSVHSFKSDNSHDSNALHIIPDTVVEENERKMDTVTNIAEIVEVQKNVMMSAAERAKKRREEEEAEYEAARERARQKAAALAAAAPATAAEHAATPALTTTSTKESDTKKPQETPSTLKKDDEKPNKRKEIYKKKETTASSSWPNSGSSEVANSSESESSKNNASSTKSLSTPKLPDTSKPWNLVAAKKESSLKIDADKTTEEKPMIAKTKPDQSESKKSMKILSKDEQQWENYVAKVKADEPTETDTTTANNWSSFSTRLQQAAIEEDAAKHAKWEKGQNRQTETASIAIVATVATQSTATDSNNDKIMKVEIIDYSNDWEASSSLSDRGNKGTERTFVERERGSDHQQNSNVRGHRNSSRTNRNNNGERDRGRGRRNSGGWLYDDQGVPVITKILKHMPKENEENNLEPIIPIKKTRSNLLKESSAPIFPESIGRLVGKKPANLSFMMDMNDEDKDITMMDQPTESHKEPRQYETFEVEPESDDERITEDDQVVPKVEKEALNSVHESMDETSATSTPRTHPQNQQPIQYSKADLSSSPRIMNVNPNFPVLVYQYPMINQAGPDLNDTGSSTFNTRPKGTQQVQQQQHPMGVYLMPQQQYLAGNQYIVPYATPAANTIQPIYLPTLPWQQQQQQQTGFNDHHHHHPTDSSTRSNHHQNNRSWSHTNSTQDYMTPSSNNHEWGHNSPLNGYQNHRQNNRSYLRGSGNRNNYRGRGAGDHSYKSRRYPDINNTQQSEPNNNASLAPSASLETSL